MLGRTDDPQAGDFGSSKLKVGTCELFQIALCRMSGREWPARHPAVWEEHDAEPFLYRPTVLTELAHQAAAGAPAPQIVVRGLALADTTLEQCVIFVFLVFFHCLSLPDDLSLLLTPRTQVRALLSHRRLLRRMGPKRPGRRCTADKRDEVAPLQSIELHLQPLAREGA
jgi:hypothetical protein